MLVFGHVDFDDFIWKPSREAVVNKWENSGLWLVRIYPSSSRVQEIFIPFGVCAVYKVMLGLSEDILDSSNRFFRCSDAARRFEVRSQCTEERFFRSLRLGTALFMRGRKELAE